MEDHAGQLVTAFAAVKLDEDAPAIGGIVE